MADNNQTVTGQDESLEERIKRLERENKGLIGDLAKKREQTRMLEERLTTIESSLSEPEPATPSSAEAEVNMFTQNPRAFILDVVKPVLVEEVMPLRKVITQDQLDRKLDRAFEMISEEEGISKKEAKKKFDDRLAKIVEENGLSSSDPYDGTVAAWKILKSEKEDRDRKEEVRNEIIAEKQTETGRSFNPRTNVRSFTSSQIAKMTKEDYAKHREEILEAARNGLIKPG